MVKQLHIISLDIPYPPDYGGMIDVFFKLKALSAEGVEITLHCFQYGKRKPAEILLRYCKTVYYYRRQTGIGGLHPSLPYIVSSRNAEPLLRNLLLNNAPILFEGIHSTFWMHHPALKNRTMILRAHNVESDYYRQLSRNTASPMKKVYYALESGRLLRYEKDLKGLAYILSISEGDQRYLEKAYPTANVRYIPAFHAAEQVSSMTGKGSYCLYHGNLSVPENIRSAKYLIEHVFNDLQIPLIIAGKNPSAELRQAGSKYVKIVVDPDEIEMQQLIQQAHIHVLPSFQQTGIKLKLLHALFAGRFCITNDDATDSVLYKEIKPVKGTQDFKQQIQDLMQKEFLQSDVENRRQILRSYLNEQSARKIVSLIW